VHEGDSDVGEDGSAAGGDLILRERGDETREKEGDVADGSEFRKVADERGGGILFWQVAMAVGRFEAGGGGTATAAGRRSVSAAWERVERGSFGFAFHIDPRFRSCGGCTRVFFVKSAEEKERKRVEWLRKMKEWGSN
jgi:hypothetical protein